MIKSYYGVSEANKSQFFELIRERGEGVLKGIINIDRWKNINKSEYFVAVGMLLK